MAGPTRREKNGNGKRERVDQEDDQEFMPLSKRINNIHLSPERMIQGVHPAFTHPGSSQNVHGHQSNNLVYPSTSTSDFPLQNGFHDSSKGHSAFHSDGSEFRHRNLQEIPPQRSDYTNSNDTLHALVARSSMNSSEQQNNISFQSNQQLRVQVPGLPNGAVPAAGSSASQICYRPSLNQTANPHYYEANRALFNLYIERQLRNNQIPHPHVFIRPPNIHDSNTRL